MEWHKSELAPDDVKALTEKYGCDLLTASILLRRGINTGEEIRYFLEDDLRHLRNPFALPGMEDAVERILAAKEEGEKVMVFGDRDVDGITGTALLTDFLRRSGFDAGWWDFPDKDEPYGLSTKAIENFAAGFGTLIITVDCGISNRDEIARAAELGVGVVVTDHHNLPEQLPDADALVNPKLPGRYSFQQLSGCAVAYKLITALRFAMKSKIYGEPICLLNTRPSNDAMIIEIAKIRNLCLIDTLTETVVPGMVRIGNTRLPEFLSGQQILCWDLPVQQKLLTQAFGKGVEIQMMDIAGEIGKAIPQTAGKSLLRLREISKLGKYSGNSTGELDVLLNLFTSFIQKTENFFDEENDADLQLAALGTIADIMPLRDENRLIVRKGIESMRKKPRPGIAELLFKLELAGRPLSAEDISWVLAPAINASGRMGEAGRAISLLLGETPKEREALVNKVIELNEQRKAMVEELYRKAEPEAYKNLPSYSGNMAVYAGENILPGLAGLIASRLSDRHKVPALAASFNGDRIKGSLRSARDYDLNFMLEQCSDLFLRFGGHDYAAGFDMERSNWDALQKRLQKIAANMELKTSVEETLVIDAEIPLSYLSKEEDDTRVRDKKDLYLLHLLDRFEPYGEKNRPLCFLSRGLKITDIMLMGKDELKHVKLTLDTGKFKWPAIYWNAAGKAKVEFDKGDTIDIVYSVNRNWFNGSLTPQMIIKDLRSAKTQSPASAAQNETANYLLPRKE